jgi:hypothetical protein
MDREIVAVDNVVQLGSIVSDPNEIIQRASVIATTLAEVIEGRKLYSVIRNKKFVQVEGWSTLGAMLGVTPRTVSVQEINDGIFEAVVELVRGDGHIIGRGIAECGSSDEIDRNGNAVWASRPRYARKSMAITRATGKAFRLAFSWIIMLAGYEAAPAEEMDGIIEAGFKNASINDDELRVHLPRAKSLFGGVSPTLAELYQKDPDYFQWMAENIEGELGDAAKKYLMQRPNDAPENDAPARPWDAEAVKMFINAREKNHLALASKWLDPDGKRRGALVGMLNELFGGDDMRHKATLYIVGEESLSGASDARLLAFKDWIKIQKVGEDWLPGEHVKEEADAVISHVLEE